MKDFFKRIWEELKRDRVREIFVSGYEMGKRHEKDRWELEIRFRPEETIKKVNEKFKS